MASKADHWRKRVEPHFSFLEQYGFRLTAVDDSSFWSLWVQYTSAVSAVRVSLSNEVFRVEVELIRLVNEDVPPYPIWIRADEPVHWALMDNVLEARSSALLDCGRTLHGLGHDEVENQLKFWASAIKSATPEFLEGDLTAIEEVEELIRERVRRNPQKMTVWLPDKRTPEQHARAVEDASWDVPTEVGVEGRRYRRGRKTDR